MKMPIECRRHNVVYDCYDSKCPECEKEYAAGERIMRRLLCDLCGELKGTTKSYCGGPVSYLCDDCKRIIDKYHELKKQHEKWLEQYKKTGEIPS